MSALIWCAIIALSLVILVPFTGIIYMSLLMDKHVRNYDE